MSAVEKVFLIIIWLDLCSGCSLAELHRTLHEDIKVHVLMIMVNVYVVLPSQGEVLVFNHGSIFV